MANDNSLNLERLTLAQRIIASSSGISSCIDMIMIQTFLLYYFTDILKLSATFSGGLLLITRICAAFASPLFGIYIDKTSTPWGKYKPYFIILGFPTAIFGFLTFTAMDLSEVGKYIYVIVTYFTYNLLTSISSVPRGAMGPAMTKNLEDRVSLGFWSYVFAVIGSLLVISAGPVLIRFFGKGSEAKGFSLTMALFGSISILIAIVQWAFLKEKYVSKKSITSIGSPIKTLVSALNHNRTAVIALILNFSTSLANGLRMAVTLHFLKYYFHRPELMSQFGLISMVSLFSGALLCTKIRKFVGVKKILIVSSIFTIASFALLYSVESSNSGIAWYLLFSLINDFCNGLANPALSTLMPNAIDYCEWKTGLNAGAFMSSINSFVGTTATAIAGVVAGVVLSTSGYQPNVEQTQVCLIGIRFLISIAPALASVIALTAIGLGNTEQEHEEIAKELTKRKYAPSTTSEY